MHGVYGKIWALHRSGTFETLINMIDEVSHYLGLKKVYKQVPGDYFSYANRFLLDIWEI